MSDEYTLILPPPDRRGHPCPDCQGSGLRADGWCSISRRADGSTEIRDKPQSKCELCRGKGRVKVLPFDDEEQP